MGKMAVVVQCFMLFWAGGCNNKTQTLGTAQQPAETQPADAVAAAGSEASAQPAPGSAGPTGVATGGNFAGAGGQAAGGGAPGGDCRSEWPEYPWLKQDANECTKCYTCPMVGVLPGAAFVACKINNRCYRFATVDNCNYYNHPKGSAGFPQANNQLYCRKDGANYSHFVCRVEGQSFDFQTMDATHYRPASPDNMVGKVADNIPFLDAMGCPK
jgi:hypothetical protein